MGGACVHHGTIPSKTLREAALTITTLRRNADVFDFKLKDNMEVSTLMRRLDNVLGSYTDFIAEYVRSHGISFFHGRASIVEPNVVEFRVRNEASAPGFGFPHGSAALPPVDVGRYRH